MSRAHELAWSAGFFDGEGYVTIQRRKTKYKDKEYTSHYLRIGVNHVAKEPLLELQRIFGGNIETQNPEKVVGNRKQRHRWTLGCTSAKEALIQMIPYFRNKNKVAELGLKLQETIQPNKKTVSEELYNYREYLKQEITKLNSLD